jgi:GT2 family glycosyltransferase
VRAAVCIASHRRPLRLRWLLDALAAQTVGDVEVVVCHSDGPESETARLLASRPDVRAVEPAGRTDPGHQRNRAWRASTASLVVFTDDDCRPPADWLEQLLAVCDAHPGAVVQGAVEPDPDEAHLLHMAPHARSLHVVPPAPYAQCANIAYPRALLERIGGFDEREPPLEGGEDTDLCRRAIEAGADYVGAPAALTWHAVDAPGLSGRLRSIRRWQHLAYTVKRHPAMRAHLFARVFWRPSHAALPLALLGLLARRPWLMLPWALLARPRYGSSPRGLARSASELPGRFVVETAELATAVRGSARYRTLFL